MIDDDRLLLPSNTARRFEYTYEVKYCPCGKCFTIQRNSANGWFVSANTHLDATTQHMSIVTACPQCGRAIDDEWLAAASETRPERIEPEPGNHEDDSGEWYHYE